MIDDSMKPLWPVPLEDSALSLLGLICVSWSQFEFLVEIALQTAGIVQLQAADGPRDISVKIGKLKKHAETRVPNKTHRKQIKDACDAGIALALRRNLAVHGKWAKHSTKDTCVAVSWFKVLPGARLSVLDVVKLPDLARDISALTKELREVLGLAGLYPASPRRYP